MPCSELAVPCLSHPPQPGWGLGELPRPQSPPLRHGKPLLTGGGSPSPLTR